MTTWVMLLTISDLSREASVVGSNSMSANSSIDATDNKQKQHNDMYVKGNPQEKTDIMRIGFSRELLFVLLIGHVIQYRCTCII